MDSTHQNAFTAQFIIKNFFLLRYSPQKKMEFDFMDEVATPQMRVRTSGSTLKGSAKKKTANFAGVIDAIKKQQRPVQRTGNDVEASLK